MTSYVVSVSFDRARKTLLQTVRTLLTRVFNCVHGRYYSIVSVSTSIRVVCCIVYRPAELFVFCAQILLLGRVAKSISPNLVFCMRAHLVCSVRLCTILTRTSFTTFCRHYLRFALGSFEKPVEGNIEGGGKRSDSEFCFRFWVKVGLFFGVCFGRCFVYFVFFNMIPCGYC